MSTNIAVTDHEQHPTRLRDQYKRWLRVSLYTMSLLAGQCTSTVLIWLYYEKGGKSKWVTTFVQSAGCPILIIPLLLYSSKRATKLTTTKDDDSSPSTRTKPKFYIVFSWYLVFGILWAMMDLMYSYALSYLPLSTFSLVCASQLGFTAVLTFFINSQKFTALISNCVFLLIISVTLIHLNAESEDTKDVPKEKRIIGFFCALAASATFALQHCLEQFCFEKVIKTEIFPAVLSMNLYPVAFAACVSLMGLFLSGEWKTLKVEMNEFENGRISYVMTLFWSAVLWPIADIGMVGLIFEVSSLFSIVIGNLELTIAPIVAVIVFHDMINGVEVIAFLLAFWGFLSYMYQHYLDHKKTKELDKSSDDIGLDEVSKGEVEI